MTLRDHLRLRLETIRFESWAPVVVAVGAFGEILERVGALSPEAETRIGMLPIASVLERVMPGEGGFFTVPEAQARLLGGSRAFLASAARNLSFVGVVGEGTREATLTSALRALAAEIDSALHRPRPSDGGGGDEAVAWLSVADLGGKKSPSN